MKGLLRRAAARFGLAFGGDPWAAEDHVPANAASEVQDFWTVDSKSGPTGAAAGDVIELASPDEGDATPLAAPDAPTELLADAEQDGPLSLKAQPDMHGLPPVDLFDLFDGDLHFAALATRPADPLDAVLPFFDAGATAARSASDIFDRPHRFKTETLAALLARETSIAGQAARDRAADVFQEALAEGRWPKMFESWMRLAPSVDCPRVLALAFELREMWEDSPHLWRYRTAPGLPSRQQSASQAYLSWRRVLGMAEATSDQPAWTLFDDDLLREWEELDAPCPGFWNFAAYAEINATGDEAEHDVMATLARHARGRRALHLQEGCGHLDFTRPRRAIRSTDIWRQARLHG